MKTLLTIAGSDPSGGAGVQADLRVFHDLGLRGLSVLTAVTAQNENKFLSVNSVSAKVLSDQLASVAHLKIYGIKIGMLGTKENVLAVIKFLRKIKIKHVVLDPILKSSTGTNLLEPNGLKALKQLIGCVSVVTPNIPEAEKLIGCKIETLEEVQRAAQKIYQSCQGVGAVLIKGGHFKSLPIDTLYTGKNWEWVHPKKRLPRDVHGTGCVFSAALIGFLVQGFSLKASAQKAKKSVAHYICERI